MWYTYFNKDSWDLRMWKGYNLRFNSNAYDMTKKHHTNKWKNLYMKTVRTTGPSRVVNILLIFAFFSIKGWYNKTTSLEVSEPEEKIEDYRNVLYLNRYGVPNRPTRSIDDALFFITNQQALDKALDFVSAPLLEANISDVEKGLDTWLNEEDKNIFNYYDKYLKNKHH